MTQAYPLAWPEGRPRRTPAQRRAGQFGMVDKSKSYTTYKSVPLDVAVRRLQAELDRLGARHVVLSTNIELRLDGQPRRDRGEPLDPGVAVYFHIGEDPPICLPCDTFTRTADNIAAIAAHIEKTRAIERYGVATIAEMFTGFAALPAPGSIPWWQILLLPRTASADEIRAAHRRLARERHPDLHGGSVAMMADLNRARDEALKERGGADA
jgi:hypothetical protein